MSEQQQVFSGRYQLVRHIARGGMAQVYLARDLLLDRPVALKVLFPELSVDESFVKRFRGEARAAANLSHPNIVSVYDWGQGEHTYFIVMEYVDGQTLAALLRSNSEAVRTPAAALVPAPPPEPAGHGVLEPAHAAAIGADVAAALEFAHRRGVIHRDVKPGNVLIDKSGNVKVTDFGIARAVGAGEGLTQTGSVMGTATYFSPEQAQGLPVDARSDVYSLGVVLYEMVVGRPPFAGDSPVSIAYKHVREVPIPPREANPDVPAAFEAVVMKAMAKSPEARYQTAEELRADLVRFRSGQPVLAVADGAPTLAGGLPPILAETTRVQPATGRTSVLPPAAPPPGPTEDRSSRSRAGRWALLALALLAAIGAAVYFIGRDEGLFAGAKTLAIPQNVVGMPASSAKAELQRLGFSAVTETSRHSSTVARGHVITTSPPPGTRQASNKPITLVVSSGHAPVKVPSLEGDTEQEATAALETDGFKVNPVSQASKTVGQGLVIKTSPPAGQEAAYGSTVTLYVSTGRPDVTIPSDLIGETPSQAGQQLGNLGLNVTQASEPSTSVPAGQVDRTSPPVGTSVPVGSTVTVYVSTGPPQVQVPNLSGDTQAQAQQALSSAGLKGSFSTQPTTNPADNGVVISQSPAPNTSVNQGSTVDVVIGSYQSTSTTSSTSTTTTSSGSGSGSGSSGLPLPGGHGPGKSA